MESDAPISERSELVAGAQVGDYEIVRELGRGGFGAVYEAVQPVIGKRVAIKVLSARYTDDQELTTRFIREAKAANRIGHPNIVDVIGFGTLDDGRHYSVMELVVGDSLRAYLDRGPLSLDQARAVLKGVVRGLQAAHRAGIVHRDLKPGNIMLHRDGAGNVQVKLLDFGIAKLMRPEDTESLKTATGMLMGTPAYMSPEQCMGPNVEAPSDVYSLGVLAFEILTGQRPFRSKTPAQLFVAHLHHTPPLPSSIVPTLPTSADRLVLSMMDKSPGRRCGLDEVLGWCEGEPTPPARRAPGPNAEPRPGAPVVSTAPRQAPPPRRAPRWAVPAFGLLAMLSVLGVGLMVKRDATPIETVTVDAPPPASPPPAAPPPQPVEPPPAAAPATTPEPPAPTPAPKTAPPVDRSKLVPIRPPPPRARRRRVEAATGSGFLTLKTTPWTQVYVDGRLIGTTPLYRFPLPAGQHQLTLTNPDSGTKARREVVVRSQRVTKKTYDLRE